MKFFNKILTLELKEPPVGFPNKFPIMFLATDEEINEYKKLMLEAVQYGFNMNRRKICLTMECNEGLTHEEIFNLVKELPEIPKEIYDTLTKIPHWNPIKEAAAVLRSYINTIQVSRKKLSDENIEEMMLESYNEARRKSEIKI